MDAQLISEDRDLYKLCREVLGSIRTGGCSLSAVGADQADPAADLWLWDYVPGQALPGMIAENPSKHLFLVHRHDLVDFREQTGIRDNHILLKPLTRATLTAFLEVALAHTDRHGADNDFRAERDEMLQCLIQANLRLQENDQDRTTFLSRAVHDFRAPLTALGGYCGLLLSEPLGPLTENQREVLRRMLHSSQRLSRMAAAMFRLSVGRHAKRPPQLQRGDLRACLDQALHEIAPAADDKSIEIKTDLAPNPFPVLLEAGQIEQVLINILDNACKFTRRGGTIEILGYPYFWDRRATKSVIPAAAERRRRSNSEPTAYRLDIRDSGNPIPPEHLEHIFEEYASYAGGSDRSGGGLGLAISRMIVNQHEGHVWAENTDFGPMFSIVLPMVRTDSLHVQEKLTRTA
jgi:signal transduction histidine kinase